MRPLSLLALLACLLAVALAAPRLALAVWPALGREIAAPIQERPKATTDGAAGAIDVAIASDGTGGAIVTWRDGCSGRRIVTWSDSRPAASATDAMTITLDVNPPPAGIALAPVSPNPASDAVTLRFTLAHAASVSLAIFDPAGRRLVTRKFAKLK